jgi:Secretion system C-terminal sorting domain
MKFFGCICLFFLVFNQTLFVKMSAQNVLISSSGQPNEPSIIIDPKNTNNLIAGVNIDRTFSSTNGGLSWMPKIVNSTHGVWGDPCVLVDTLGDFYYFHLSNPSSEGDFLDRIVCQKTTDLGASFTNGSFTGVDGTSQHDKHWTAIDRRTNTIYLTWTKFEAYGSNLSTDSTYIMFSKSTDLGLSWSNPKRINKTAGDCVDSDNSVMGAVPAVGPNGELYVSWASPNGLAFNKSMDGGDTWLAEELIISTMPGGWDLVIPGLDRSNGLPVINCDVSTGPSRGTIYVNWADQRNGVNNTDIWLVKSIDNGVTWTNPQLVNDDTTQKHQFLTWMTIDQSNGNLYFIFYDRRDHDDNATDVYLGISNDAGNTILNRKISASPFTPSDQAFFGDYNNITAHNNIVRPIWTRVQNGNNSVWTDVTPIDQTIAGIENIDEFTNTIFDFESSPNPSENTTYIYFKTKRPGKISITLLDLNGKELLHIVENKQVEIGKYAERIDFNNFDLPKAVYLIKVQINGDLKVKRFVKI